MPGNQPDFNKTIKKLREALEDYFDRQEGKSLQDLEVIGISRRSFSVIAFLKARTSKDLLRLVSKTTIHHPENIDITEKENQALIEYNLLKFLHPKFETVEKCSVPRPILVVPEIETYVMEFVEGNLLVDENRYARYFSSKGKFNTLKEYYYLCGRWLKHFQEFTGVREETEEALHGVIKRCDSRLRLIEDLKDSRCPKILRDKVVGFLCDQIKQMNGKKILVSGRHGDFGSWNILIGQKGVTVVDYLGYGEDPIVIDILKMLMNFEDEKKYFTNSPTRVEILRNCFLKGFGTIPFITKPELTICETLHRVYSVHSSLSYPGKYLHHRFEKNLCLKANLNWLINSEEKDLLFPTANIQY